MSNIIVIGGIAWDWVYPVARLDSVPSEVSQQMLTNGRPGGSAANVARALASAGHNVYMIARVGNDRFGEESITDLKSWNVDTRWVKQIRGATRSVILFIDGSGERKILPLEGEDISEIPRGADLRIADCIYVGNPLPAYVRRLKQVDESSLVISSFPSPEIENWPANMLVDSITSMEGLSTVDSFKKSMKVVGSRLKWVVVTEGANGATAYGEDDQIIHQEGTSVRAVDTTGAGDSFVSGMIHGILSGLDLRQSMDIGAIWGAKAVTRHASVPPAWNEIGLEVARRVS